MLTVLQNGNVGIGTGSPGYDLQIGDNAVADRVLRINSDTASAYMDISNSGNFGGINLAGSQNFQLQSSGVNGYMTFHTAGSERIRILNNGNVGIGTTTPSAKLQITGTAGTANPFMVASSSNTAMMTLSSAGNLTVTGNTSSTQFCLSGSCISTWGSVGSTTYLTLNQSTPQTLTFAGSDTFKFNEFAIDLSGYGYGTYKIPVANASASGTVPAFSTLLSGGYALNGPLFSLSNDGLDSNGNDIIALQAYDFKTSDHTLKSSQSITMDRTNGGWILSGTLNTGNNNTTINGSGDIATNGSIQGNSGSFNNWISTVGYLGVSLYGQFGKTLEINNTGNDFGLRVHNLPSGTLASPPAGLTSGDMWKDTTDSVTDPIVRIHN